jgi:8-oxo-dGTP pyrophosphatase MutT (NUDIX family)
MDAVGAASGLERTRVVIIRNNRVAAIERFRQGRRYWVLPGGGVEAGETIAQAALRETAEELGLDVRLGPLRAVVYGLDAAGAVLRHWCFDAGADSDDIGISGGPELISTPESGTYKAVWLDLAELGELPVWPSALARLVAVTRGSWPDDVLEISDDDS